MLKYNGLIERVENHTESNHFSYSQLNHAGIPRARPKAIYVSNRTRRTWGGSSIDYWGNAPQLMGNPHWTRVSPYVTNSAAATPNVSANATNT
jgi:hypothetical protein